MALAADSSTPALATNTNSTVAALTTASFTPPAACHLVAQWMGNTDSGASYGPPTISDSEGLTWHNYGYATLANSSTGDVDGMVAQWVAPFGLSSPMTVTVTSPAPSGFRQAALKIWVVTGSDLSGDSVSPAVGAYGMGDDNSAPASALTQLVATQADDAMGFMATEDWNAGAAGSAGTGMTSGGHGVISSALTYSFIRKTTPDILQGQDMPMIVNRTVTSANLRWVYLELVPDASKVEIMASASSGRRSRSRRQARFIR